MSDILDRAEAIEKLYLPWQYDKCDDQIVSQDIETETGDCGAEIARWNEQICQYLGEKRSKEIIEAVNLLPELIAEIKRLRWQRQDLAMATPCSTDDQLSQRKYDFSEAVVQNAMTPHRPTPKQINYTDGLKRMIARDEQQAAYVTRLEAAFLEADERAIYWEYQYTGTPITDERRKEKSVQLLEKIRGEQE